MINEERKFVKCSFKKSTFLTIAFVGIGFLYLAIFVGDIKVFQIMQWIAGLILIFVSLKLGSQGWYINSDYLEIKTIFGKKKIPFSEIHDIELKEHLTFSFQGNTERIPENTKNFVAFFEKMQGHFQAELGYFSVFNGKIRIEDDFQYEFSGKKLAKEFKGGLWFGIIVIFILYNILAYLLYNKFALVWPWFVNFLFPISCLLLMKAKFQIPTLILAKNSIVIIDKGIEKRFFCDQNYTPKLLWGMNFLKLPANARPKYLFFGLYPDATFIRNLIRKNY